MIRTTQTNTMTLDQLTETEFLLVFAQYAPALPEGYQGDRDDYMGDLANAIDDTLASLRVETPEGADLDWLGDIYEWIDDAGWDWED